MYVCDAFLLLGWGMGGEKAQFEVNRPDSVVTCYDYQGLKPPVNSPHHLLSQHEFIQPAPQRPRSTSPAGMNCVYPAPEALLGDRLPERPNEDPTTRATRDPPRAPAPETLLPPLPQAHSPYRVHNCQSSSGPHGQRRKRKGTQRGYSTRRRETRLGQKKETGEGRLSGKAGRKTRDWLRVGDVCAVCSTWSRAPGVVGPGRKRGPTASPVLQSGDSAPALRVPACPPQAVATVRPGPRSRPLRKPQALPLPPGLKECHSTGSRCGSSACSYLPMAELDISRALLVL